MGIMERMGGGIGPAGVGGAAVALAFAVMVPCVGSVRFVVHVLGSGNLIDFKTRLGIYTFPLETRKPHIIFGGAFVDCLIALDACLSELSRRPRRGEY